MINREGQVWQVTNMVGGWTVYLVTSSADDCHVGIVLDSEGPLSGNTPGQTIITFEDDSTIWEDDIVSGERTRLA